MRVIGGTAKGIKLNSVPGETTRPILDRVKVPLFDILSPEIENARFLDLFAGSGGVGIEALSRGARQVIFVEIARAAQETIASNLRKTKLESNATIFKGDAFAFIKRSKDSFDHIYIAPPQFKGLWIEAVRAIAERPSLVNQRGKIIAQIHPQEYEILSLATFSEIEKRRYGSTELVFYQKT
ncbi:MAG TPA: 16S rRNA (guanine(966)-N(2))-methyltransferase RsmD [Oligoflexia bacterium]|nr:16S rRNA (guanine(966)-N(2))-methyltransferase RsmD [Oligoflexia bacterium]HMP26381.1 16S rRNA (guanine(966)-N(2))-methyltransferase RsmD [Oligoflexia bacterium]